MNWLTESQQMWQNSKISKALFLIGKIFEDMKLVKHIQITQLNSMRNPQLDLKKKAITIWNLQTQQTKCMAVYHVLFYKH